MGARAFSGSQPGSWHDDTSSTVCLRAPPSTLPAATLPRRPQRSPPSLLTTAACGDVRSTPDGQPRRAPFISRTVARRSCGPAAIVTQDRYRTSGSRIWGRMGVNSHSPSRWWLLSVRAPRCPATGLSNEQITPVRDISRHGRCSLRKQSTSSCTRVVERRDERDRLLTSFACPINIAHSTRPSMLCGSSW
jgi:hypothetical protein